MVTSGTLVAPTLGMMTEPHHEPHQVVVAYDFSGAGALVLERAIELACRAPFHVLHFLTVIDPRIGIPSIPADGDIDYRYAEKVQTVLAKVVADAFVAHHASREVHFFVHSRFGKPADEILHLAEEIGADLVLVGSHGHTGMRRFLLGSTAEKVVREAGCPVVVARQPSYKKVELLEMVDIGEHSHKYTPPHRYVYENRRVQTRPVDWPLY